MSSLVEPNDSNDVVLLKGCGVKFVVMFKVTFLVDNLVVGDYLILICDLMSSLVSFSFIFMTTLFYFVVSAFFCSKLKSLVAFRM